MRYKLIIFDLDGTLYKIPKGINKKIEDRVNSFYAEKFNLKKREAERIRNKLKKKYGTSILVFRKFGIDENEFYEKVFGDINPKDYIKEDKKLIKILKEIGLKKVILTNSPRFFALKVLDALKIDQNIFDLIVTANDYHTVKPNKEAFLNITNYFNISPLETIVVGDEAEKDLKTAHELGMKTILVGSKKSDYIDFKIDSIYEIKEILNNKKFIN
jgi:putative hydrolase of the HAD superfamily